MMLKCRKSLKIKRETVWLWIMCWETVLHEHIVAIFDHIKLNKLRVSVAYAAYFSILSSSWGKGLSAWGRDTSAVCQAAANASVPHRWMEVEGRREGGRGWKWKMRLGERGLPDDVTAQAGKQNKALLHKLIITFSNTGMRVILNVLTQKRSQTYLYSLLA